MTVPVNLRQPKKPKKSNFLCFVTSLSTGGEETGDVSGLVDSLSPVLADLGKGEGGTTVLLAVESRRSVRDVEGLSCLPVTAALGNSKPQAGQQREVTLWRNPQRGHVVNGTCCDSSFPEK